MPATLANFLNEVSPEEGELHLVHCTTLLSGVDALNATVLEPRPCPVYESDLLYFFYGRPAYKPAAGAPASQIIDLAPVCLVLDPTLLVGAKRILPFDSGGFDRYADVLGRQLKLDQFELTGDATAPRRLVKAFYDSPRNYYDQAPTLAEKNIAVSRSVARGYARLIADPSLRAVDDRCGTIEIQLDGAVDLKAALRAIIAPSVLFDDPEIKAVLTVCPDVDLLPYKVFGRFEPGALSYALYERVELFHQRLGALP